MYQIVVPSGGENEELFVECFGIPAVLQSLF